MKKELTKEIVFAYLPHDVQVVWGNSSIPESLRPANFPSDWHVSKNFRLCLRPLSDLTKPITHNGETFDPIERIKEMTGIDASILPDVFISALPNVSYKVTKILHSWHFDTFDLGSDNLCVYMNPDGTLLK